MNSLLILAITAIVIQFLTERIKPLIQEKYHAKHVPFLALILGVIISFATQTGLFTAVGVHISPIWIDYIITGIAYSGGAVAFNELLKLISELRPSNKNEL